MKKLIKRHQAATWERGHITPNTTIDDFIDKISEEFSEFRNAYRISLDDDEDEQIMTEDMAHEAVDICAVVINMLTFYGIDFEKEFCKNVDYQESRII